MNNKKDKENFEKKLFEYKEKRGTKLIFGKNVYYIKYEDQLLGIVEE